MKLLNKNEIIIKKSRFIGLYYEVTNLDEIKSILEDIKKEHKKARHIPYAYKIDNIVKKSDDKEPSNTAGGPILNVIEKRNLNNCLIISIRYFGGIKLGSGGLIRAYGEIARLVTDKEKEE